MRPPGSSQRSCLLRLLALLSFMAPLPVVGQDSAATISGQVIDSLGHRLVNAQVSIGPRRQPGTLTDSLGQFRLDAVKPGDALVETGAIGYETRWHRAHLVPGQILEVTFVMGPPISLPGDAVVVDSLCDASGCRKR